MRVTSYHNHTSWSDGGCSVAEQVERARREGLDEVGISDHFVVHPNGAPVTWSMPLEELGAYVAEVRDAAGPEPPIVRLGVEADFFPQTVERVGAILAEHPFDYVIGSVHYLDGFPIDGHRRHWEALTQDGVNAAWRDYWLRVQWMAESRVFDFAAHLDLPKKFGFRPTIDLTVEVDAALDALRQADMAIEINTAGWSVPAAEAYPAPDILRAARRRGIPLLINADAHKPANLVRDFDRALRLARDAGYTELVRYERRERIAVPIDGPGGA